jgi:dTDP-4-amino-4,6-dideoxygalactose transaminase
MKKLIYNSQFVEKKDEYEVSKSLRDDKITTGKYVIRFENNIKKFLGCNYVVTTSSGTSALDLAFKSISLKKDDVVIMPSINFISSYSMAKQYGASIYLADVCPRNGQITYNSIRECIRKNKLKKIKAIVVMYLGGYVDGNIDLYKIKKKFKCFLIEDACHAFGSEYKFSGKKIKIGSCKHCDLSTFSFHPLKTITTAEGGAVTTNNQKLFQNLLILRSHGIIRKKKYWDYDIDTLSNNYRLSDVNCALGVSQLKKVNKIIKKRKSIYLKYTQIYNNDKIFKIYKKTSSCEPSFHLVLFKINFTNKKINKDHLFKFMNQNDIYPQYHYKPIYKFKFFKKNKFFEKDFIGSEAFYKKFISFPIHYRMKLSDVARIKSTTDKFKKLYNL